VTLGVGVGEREGAAPPPDRAHTGASAGTNSGACARPAWPAASTSHARWKHALPGDVATSGPDTLRAHAL
jgi:hypothetical protein